MTQRTRIVFKYILLILWMIVIFKMSSEVAAESSARSGAVMAEIKSLDGRLFGGITTFLVRKSAHISAYFVLGILAYSLMLEYHLSKKRTIQISILIAFLYSISDEFHQLFVTGRSGEMRDILIDTLGSALGVAVILLIVKITHRLKAQTI